MMAAADFCIASSENVYCDAEIDAGHLISRRLLKTASLLFAHRAGVPVPKTLLLLDRSRRAMEAVASWPLPLMLRMDYEHLPRQKPLGGIPIMELRSLKAVIIDLMSIDLLPLLHPNLDRFSDIYSVGMLLGRHSDEVQLEIVGRGFDASDLRLGSGIQHESITCDLRDAAIRKRVVIQDTDYARERMHRAKRIASLQLYSAYVNRCGRFDRPLETFVPSPEAIDTAGVGVPPHYRPMGRKEISQIVSHGWTVQSEVLTRLPDSNLYVASLSLLPRIGWMLWDVYGHWYKR